MIEQLDDSEGDGEFRPFDGGCTLWNFVQLSPAHRTPDDTKHGSDGFMVRTINVHPALGV